MLAKVPIEERRDRVAPRWNSTPSIRNQPWAFLHRFRPPYGTTAALIAGIVFLLLALGFWYGLGFTVKAWMPRQSMGDKETKTPLPAKIDQMLTEARLILPGAQALLGFQLIVALTRTCEQLPATSRLLHV